MAREMAHPAVASPRGFPRIHLEVELVAGQEDQVGQSQVGEAGDHVVHVGQVEHVGAHQDAEADLDDDLGDGQSPGQLGEKMGASTAAKAMRTSVVCAVTPVAAALMPGRTEAASDIASH